jgi:hypothetical protein
MFWVLNIAAWSLTILFLFFILFLAQRKNWRCIDADSRQMYIDLGKSLITSAGIASAIIVGTYAKGVAPEWMAGRALIWLVACIIFATFYAVALSRFYEMAHSRGDDLLKNWELRVILILSLFALGSFLTGFLYIGRIGYLMSAYHAP